MSSSYKLHGALAPGRATDVRSLKSVKCHQHKTRILIAAQRNNIHAWGFPYAIVVPWLQVRSPKSPKCEESPSLCSERHDGLCRRRAIGPKHGVSLDTQLLDTPLVSAQTRHTPPQHTSHARQPPLVHPPQRPAPLHTQETAMAGPPVRGSCPRPRPQDISAPPAAPTPPPASYMYQLRRLTQNAGPEG